MGFTFGAGVTHFFQRINAVRDTWAEATSAKENITSQLNREQLLKWQETEEVEDPYNNKELQSLFKFHLMTPLYLVNLST